MALANEPELLIADERHYGAGRDRPETILLLLATAGALSGCRCY